MKRLIFILFTLCITAGCSGKRNRVDIRSDRSITITVRDIPDEVAPIEEIVDSIGFIRLGLTDPPIADIAEINYADSMIIVTDAERRLLFFDYDGRFLRELSKRGRGTGEYLKISRTMLDRDAGEIIIHDLSGRKLLYYDLQGNYLRGIDKFNGGEVARDVTLLPDKGFLCYRPDRSAGSRGDAYSGIWQTDSLGNFVKYYYDNQMAYPLVMTRFPFYFANVAPGTIGAFDQNMTSVYHWNGGDMTQYCRFVFPGGKTLADYAGVERTEKDYFMAIGYSENERFLLTDWLDKDNYPFVVIYDKSDNGLNIARYYPNTILGEFAPASMAVRDNLPDVHTMLIAPGLLYAYLNDPNVRPFDREGARRLAGDMDEEQELKKMNPVLQLLYLKR